jgi:hypothetical protein
MLVAGLAAPIAAAAQPARAAAFDHSHAAWTALLNRHVVVLRGGQASRVRYAGFAADRAALQAYLAALAAPGETAFEAFDAAQQMAFLINAYNAATVELILTKYPDLKSIKDLGTFFESPWKSRRVSLFGARHSLDDIEHGMLRRKGRYDDPRVHFAVNCASIGCPALREEAFTAEQLDRQLDEQALRFMSDRARNRYSAQRARLEVSKIFDWYGEDFRQGLRGIDSLAAFMARYAEQLADAPADRAAVRARKAAIAFLDYDWALNDAG